jgi:5-methylcytosine-specific restriction endonuclease McrA
MVTAGSSAAWQFRYDGYVRGSKWRNMRDDMIRLRGEQCERCGYRYELQLHHRSYERLGRELISDLEVLCQPCHEKADEERALQGQARRYNAALDTYATKKYGEGWNFQRDPDQVAEEFDQWLERKQED